MLEIFVSRLLGVHVEIEIFCLFSPGTAGFSSEGVVDMMTLQIKQTENISFY